MVGKWHFMLIKKTDTELLDWEYRASTKLMQALKDWYEGQFAVSTDLQRAAVDMEVHLSTHIKKLKRRL